MKRLMHCLMVLATAIMLPLLLQARALTPGTTYFIVHNIYDKALGSSEDGTKPAISAFITNNADSASYVFEAEESGKDGYVLLRQKSTGRYLASSTSNAWSIVFQDTKKTDDAYCWKADEGFNSFLINKRNTSSCMGIDGAQKDKDYVEVYYNKPKASHSSFRIIPTADNNYDQAHLTYEPDIYTNAIGNREKDLYKIVNRRIEIAETDTMDLHLTANDEPIRGLSARITMKGTGTWIIFDNITPDDVIKNYLKYIYYGVRRAANGSNCRVEIYLNGAAVIPMPAGSFPLDFYTEKNLGGEQSSYRVGVRSDLGTHSNTTRSFVLRRGYMATIATSANGKGYSRVFVADHQDLVLNTLPMALDKRITSVTVKPWPYLSKKGWGYTGGSSGTDKLRATWYWTWGADYSSSTNFEYVPCLQHRYWPSSSQVNSKTGTASLSLNEPEHSEQHENCSCGGTTNEWTAYTFNDKFLDGGGRIGSPQPTDFSYLTNFFKHVDNMGSRCDFAVTHSYWDLAGMNETDYANWYCNTKCKSVWDNTGRPLWITEFNISASWNTNNITSYEHHRKYMQALLAKVEESPWIERYAVYGVDKWETYMFYDGNPSKGLTPAGQLYRDHRATFAYNSKYTKIPVWWAPSAKTPSLEMSKDSETGKLQFTITNPNKDMTDELYVERQKEDGSWEKFAEVTERHRFENQTVVLSDIDAANANLETDRFRVTVVTLNGVTVSGTEAMGLLTNAIIEATSKTEINGWTCSKDAQNGYTKADKGDTFFEVWHPKAAEINFDYYQDVTNLDNGIYRLTANVFNTTNRVEGATLNGAVGLYAQTTDQLYFAPVTDDDSLNLERVTMIDNIVVTDGNLRAGIRNLGTMSGRWAGGDNFILVRTGDLESIYLEKRQWQANKALYDLMPAWEHRSSGDDTRLDATRFIINPDANKKNSYGWTTKNVDFKTGNESFNADANNNFWNIWKSGEYTSELSQTIYGLPTGSYALSALVRASADDKNKGIVTTVTLTAAAALEDGSSDSTNLATKVFKGTGATALDNAEYPQGWQRIETAPVKIAQGQSLNIAFNMTTTGSAWWSADHFQLICTPDLTDEPEPLAIHLAFDTDSTGVVLNDDFNAPTLDNPNNVPVTWVSSDESVATVDAEGHVTILAIGSTTITASYAGNEFFAANAASYKLTVSEFQNAINMVSVRRQPEVIDIAGRRIKTSAVHPGIYIMNGKKVIVR